MNEFDRFVHHLLKPCGYIRYGDDFIIVAQSYSNAVTMREHARRFLTEQLGLSIHPKHDILLPIRRGVHFLGTDIYPKGSRLSKIARARCIQKIIPQNSSSYLGPLQKFDPHFGRQLLWQLIARYDSF